MQPAVSDWVCLARDYGDWVIGGAKGDRTLDLMTASHALSQLSYGPIRIAI